MKKICFKCGEEKHLSEYYVHAQMGDGHLNKCKECTKADVRGRSQEQKEAIRSYDKYRYRHDFNRMKQHKYRGIKNRCLGKHKNRTYRVEGMPFLSQQEYDMWWEQNLADFKHCHNIWERSGFRNKFAPSIDRIDSRKGYTPENMQWLLFTDNCSKYDKQ